MKSLHLIEQASKQGIALTVGDWILYGLVWAEIVSCETRPFTARVMVRLRTREGEANVFLDANRLYSVAREEMD